MTIDIKTIGQKVKQMYPTYSKYSDEVVGQKFYMKHGETGITSLGMQPPSTKTSADLLAERKTRLDQGLDTSDLDTQLQTSGVDMSSIGQGKQEALEKAIDLSKSNYKAIVGPELMGGKVKLGRNPFAYLSGSAQNTQNMYDTLISTLTLENVNKMKGVLSDSDIKMLKESSSSLKTNTNNKLFKKNLDKVIEILGKPAMGQPGGLSADDEALIKKYGGK